MRRSRSQSAMLLSLPQRRRAEVGALAGHVGCSWQILMARISASRWPGLPTHCSTTRALGLVFVDLGSLRSRAYAGLCLGRPTEGELSAPISRFLSETPQIPGARRPCGSLRPRCVCAGCALRIVSIRLDIRCCSTTELRSGTHGLETRARTGCRVHQSTSEHSDVPDTPWRSSPICWTCITGRGTGVAD